MTTQDNCHVHSVPSVADSRTCLCDTQIVPGWSSRCAQSHVHLIPPQPCRNNQSGKKKGPCRALPTSPVLCPHSPSPMINLAHLKEEGPLVLSSREVSGRDYPTSQTSGLSIPTAFTGIALGSVHVTHQFGGCKSYVSGRMLLPTHSQQRLKKIRHQEMRLQPNHSFLCPCQLAVITVFTESRKARTAL